MEECITCGGAECSTRVAGFGQFDCCVGPIVDTGVYCSESGEAPCIVDEGLTLHVKREIDGVDRRMIPQLQFVCIVKGKVVQSELCRAADCHFHRLRVGER